MKQIPTLFGVAALMCAGTTGVHAQHTVRIATEVERIENPLLVPVSPGGATVFRVAADYAYELLGDRTRSRFSAGAVVESSSNTALLASRTYPSLGYTWAYNWPTANLELRANVAEAATRNTQFEELGRVTVDAKERTTVAGAMWNKELTDRTQLTLDVADNRVRYSSPFLESYREVETSSRFSWDQSEATVYYFEPGYARLTPSRVATESSLTRWIVGTRRELAPEWSMTAFAGQARMRGLSTETQTLGGLGLSYTGSRLSAGLDWIRDVQPTGATSGYVRTEEMGVRVGYQLTESARVSASAARNRWAGIAGGLGHISRLALENELSRGWSTLLAVEDRRFRDAAGASGSGWAVRAGLVYTYADR